MQAMAIAGVLALAGLGAAGAAAADGGDDCVAGAVPVAGGFYGLCLFEENAGSVAWRHCSWTACYDGSRAWSEHRLASAAVDPRLGPAQAGAGAEAAQREEHGWQRATDAFGSARSAWDHNRTWATASASAATPATGVNASAAGRQWDDAATSCDRWGCSAHATEGTLVVASAAAGPLHAQAAYAQARSDGGDCLEVAQASSSLAGHATQAQPCTAEAPQLLADPATRFPDAPDGTGLPFL